MQKTKGFTLIELLIVIAIIGILAGIIAPRLSGSMDGAKEQHCRNNLRQLQAAVVDFAADQGGNLPFAQSHEVYYLPDNSYHERRGWVTWVPADRSISTLDGLWDGQAVHTSHSGELSDDLGHGEDAKFAIEYGTLFDYVGDARSYYCPTTARNASKFMQEGSAEKADIRRTYAMNPFFGAASNRKNEHVKITHVGISQGYSWKTDNKSYSYVPEADKLLLFSECFPSPSGEGGVRRSGYADAARGGSRAYDACIVPEKFDDVSLSGIVQQGELITGLHPGSIDYQGTSLPSALAVFFDGHIEKVFPVPETADGKAGSKANTAWFLNRGFRPGDKDPTR